MNKRIWKIIYGIMDKEQFIKTKKTVLKKYPNEGDIWEYVNDPRQEADE